MVKDSQIKITDTVVMGDVNQIISGNECPGCFSSNVRVMMCQISDCETKFCELCHAKSRFSEGHFERFDSGHGSGPFCAKCLITQRTIHGAENVNINFNLNSIEADEMNELKDSLQKGFSITQLNVSQESVNFVEMVQAKMDENIHITKNNFESKWNQIEQQIETPTVIFKFSVFKKIGYVWVLLMAAITEDFGFDLGVFGYYDWRIEWDDAFGSVWAILVTLSLTILGVFIWARNLACKRIVITANRHYYELSLENLRQREDRIREALNDFRISSNYSNLYHQTEKSEFEVIGFISEFTQVILRRRAHRKFATNAEESAQWISDLKWDQIVSISVDEYTKVLIGEELNFDAQTWAKREVMTWN